MGAHSAADRPRRHKAKHRAPSEQRIERYTLLGAGAITLGIGAAIASAGAAGAETESGDGAKADASQAPATEQGSKDGGSEPNRGPAKPESTVGSGRPDAADKKDAAKKEPESDSTPKAGSPAAKGPLTSLAASGGNLRTEISGAVKKARVIGEKLADKLDPAPDTATSSKDAEPASEPETTVEDLTPHSAALAFLQNLAPQEKKAAKPVAAELTEPAEEELTDPSDTLAPDLLAELEPEAAAGPVPWSPNPFRPMPPEPAPNDMPGLIWNVEQNIVDAFAGIPGFQPFVREGFEAGFRVSQFIPWVNAVIPVINIVEQLPNLASGDGELVRDATQRIVNNLLITLQPVSTLYYGYDEVADLINLEYEAQQLKEWFYATTWDILDPFALLHNRGVSGLPMSTSSPGAASTTSYSPGIALMASARAVVPDEPGSNPFRAQDPDPRGMPQVLLDARNAGIAVLPDALDPIFREAFEAVYRGTQIVPYVNAVVPITEILPALIQAASGDKEGAQVAINQLLITTGPVSVLYYGYDQIADLLNIDHAAADAKEQLYIGLWDAIDSQGVLHPKGKSGLPA